MKYVVEMRSDTMIYKFLKDLFSHLKVDLGGGHSHTNIMVIS
jgi:hypothetical protein